jgi:hypothetical protein
MPKSSIIFAVPDELAKIAEVLANFGGEMDNTEITGDPEEVAAILEGVRGQTVSVDFDVDDPQEPILRAAEALDATGSRYFGIYDAFSEPTRGVRVEGAVVLNASGAPSDKTDRKVPWTYGEPEFDRHTLSAAGFSPEETDGILATFFGEKQATPSLR